ncbi:MAG: T9SS type A sorting domain-containing protein, partial [Ferruginibacter sp.]
LYPVDISEKILNSSHIIEGKVLEQRSFWNPGHTMIYTSNFVEVYKTFKGTVQSGTIEVITTGGTVGLESIEASDLLTLEKDNIGLFFCYPNSIRLLSPFTGNRLFDVYASGQGCFIYDLNTKSASAPFVRYSNIQEQLYRELTQDHGLQITVINPAFDLANIRRPANTLAPAISSFSPQVVNAGAILDPGNNLLTINGSGFGNTPTGSAAVIFDDANNGSGGSGFSVAYNSPLVQSWSDIEIRIRVPGRAGTGKIQVSDQAGTIITSAQTLTVNYAVSTSQFTVSGNSVIKESNLMNDNGSGGYTILYSTNTDSNGINLDSAPEKATFQRALNTWKEITGVNFIEGGTTTFQTVNPTDGENVIMFDNNNTGNTVLASGVLAVCYSFNNICTNDLTNEGRKTEFDIVIRNIGVSTGSTSFTIGPCAPASPFGQIDLETVLLHELGHALNLAHVNDSYQGTTLPFINPGKLMNFSILPGVSRKSPDYAAYTGALYSVTPQSNAYGSCTLSNKEMIPLARTVVAEDECPVSFPAVSTPANTVINFDLVHATSNKFSDPAYNRVTCTGRGTSVTNNAYYAIKSNSDGGDLDIFVSGYAATPASVEGSCSDAGILLALYKVNSCPAGQSFPSPLVCRSFSSNGALPLVTGLVPNANYLIYVDGISNTKASFTLTLNESVLPVTLLDFVGIMVNNKVNLSWKTTREINCREFMVEKSLDGDKFNRFAVVSAKGNSIYENRYNATDDKPYPGYTFYRLKMLDNDGRFRYSGIVKIKTPQNAVVVSSIFPNPASSKINFQIVADSRKTLTVQVFDLLGKKLADFALIVIRGVNEKQVFIEGLASGPYFIQVKDAMGNVIEKSKFIKN